jgi:hypothetical protein
MLVPDAYELERHTRSAGCNVYHSSAPDERPYPATMGRHRGLNLGRRAGLPRRFECDCGDADILRDMVRRWRPFATVHDCLLERAQTNLFRVRESAFSGLILFDSREPGAAALALDCLTKESLVR